MNQHTPGPWHITTDRENVVFVDGAYRDGEPYHICRISGSNVVGPMRKIYEANARLIAKAPEMLALLVRLAAQSPKAQSDRRSAQEDTRALLREIEGERT